MRVFIRDFRILFISIRDMFIAAISLNIVISLVLLFFDKTIGNQNFAIPFPMIMITLNVGLLGVFFIKYFVEWRPQIHEEFRQARLQNKYKFFTDRFK